MVIHRVRWFSASVPLALILLAGAAPEVSKSATDLPVNRLVGQRLANFTLNDVTTGKPVSLYGFRNKKALAVVLVFLGTDCPVANLYTPRLAELNKEFEEKHVYFLGINSNAHDTVAQVAAHAKENAPGFPVLKDEGNIVADSALVQRTCEAIVLDGLAVVRYRGAIDDQYGQGTRKPAAEHEYLRDAIREVITGGRVDVKATAAVGCLLDKVDPRPKLGVGNTSRVRAAAPEIMATLKEKDESEESKVGPVTYASDVAALVQNKCQKCHRPGEVGPFPLLTYDDARKHAAMIREVIDDRRMPPWHADPRFGHFQNDRSLSSKERATLLAWVDQGTPLGDASKIPLPRVFPEGWTIGTPDVVFEIPEALTVPAQGTVEYVHVRVPTKFKEDVWVQAAEARPGDRSVVHHIIVYVIERNVFRPNRPDRAEGHLCGYAPGDMPSIYPEGAAKRIPAGSDLLFQIHYTPTGKVLTDRSKVAMIFAKSPVKNRAFTHGIAQPRFQIPPGADNHAVASTFTLEKDIHLLSLLPHMHLRGKSFRFEATYPDGKKETLLSVPAFDFGWQSYYTLAEPKAMPKGTRIDCEAHFDNSAKNPYNPDPSKAVRWGEQTWEEMMIGFFDVSVPMNKTAMDLMRPKKPAPQAGSGF
jgi:peroxiredoxin/mono/diheme cytochrome c family protein